MITHIGEAVLDYTMNGRVWGLMGNRHPSMAPHGCYHCKEQEEQITIAVSSDEEWQALCKAIGNPPWTKEERFSTAQGRWQNQDELDGLIEEWTSKHHHYEAMHILQQAGVPAGAVLNPRDVLLDPQLLERRFFRVIEHDQDPGVGRRPQPMQMPAKFSEAEGGPLRPAPRLGQHNEYILGELLKMSKEELASLEEEKVIGTTLPLRLPWSGLKLDKIAAAGGFILDRDYLKKLSSAYGEHIGPTVEGDKDQEGR